MSVLQKEQPRKSLGASASSPFTSDPAVSDRTGVQVATRKHWCIGSNQWNFHGEKSGHSIMNTLPKKGSSSYRNYAVIPTGVLEFRVFDPLFLFEENSSMLLSMIHCLAKQ